MVLRSLLRWVGGVGVGPHGGARCVGQEVSRRPHATLNLRTHWTHWLIDSHHRRKIKNFHPPAPVIRLTIQQPEKTCDPSTYSTWMEHWH